MVEKLPHFELRVQAGHRCARIVVLGELDLATAPALQAAIASEQTEGRDLILDIEALEFIDSTGLRVLIEADAACRGNGWDFAVTPGRGAVRRAFELSGLDRHLRFTT